MPTFVDFFRGATGNPNPFPYQTRFAEADQLPELVHAPTGAGKTATAVLGWAWRYFHSSKPTPRRLVYCLPMRVLVEQTRNEAKKWLATLGLPVKVHVLMGGEDAEEWDLEPEKPAVVIGTQDVLLSRALNRGYGMGRFRWPMHFGLLNNDCLWVLDEIQLMGTGLATSTQLQAFRESLGTFGPIQTIWMSATLLPSWLASVDYRNRVEPKLNLRTLALNPEADYQADGLRERWEAKKPIQAADLEADDTEELAKFVVAKHQEGSLTLVIVNTVDRSRKLFAAIRRHYAPPPARGRRKAGAVPEPKPAPDLKLIHSRFRPKERQTWREWLAQSPARLREQYPLGRIIVSTQVVEAGVDLSAQTLITELAPWPSLVQRFGRCNRRGEFGKDNPAQVFWVDVPSPDDKKAAPYSKAELDAARERITGQSDVGLKSLTEFFARLSNDERATLFPFDPPHVVRRKDFIDLFDTTPDLAGNDIDVSRFIREGDDIDVQVFWRLAEPPKGPISGRQARRIAPVRDELCPVKLSKDGGIKGFLEKHTAYRWDALESEWVAAKPADVYPGQVYWITTAEGGYDAVTGWEPDGNWPAGLWTHDPDAEPVPETTEEPAYDSDEQSAYPYQTIAEHTDDVAKALGRILEQLRLNDLPSGLLELAVRWHDWGKAHVVFQRAIQKPADWRPGTFLAKAPEDCWDKYDRKHFRHELASALGVLTLLRMGQPPAAWAALEPHLQNLGLYLIASHHGKVRLSIRSMPDERIPDDPAVLFARGVWQGDQLPAVDLGGVTTPAVPLDLSPMLLGRVDGHPSWAERMLGVRDHPDIGPLRLAYLEAILRAADMRASKDAERNGGRK